MKLSPWVLIAGFALIGCGQEQKPNPYATAPRPSRGYRDPYAVDEAQIQFKDHLESNNNWNGELLSLEFTDRDGQVKLIEANPRLSGGGDAAPYAGVDLPWLHYLDLIGQRVEPVVPSGRDFRHVVVRADGKALPAYWKAGLLDLGGAWRSLRPPLAFYDLDARDWAYSFETLLIAGRSFVREAFSGGQS